MSQVPEPPPAPAQERSGSIACFPLWDNAPWDEATGTSTSVVAEEDGAIGTNGYVARMIKTWQAAASM